MTTRCVNLISTVNRIVTLVITMGICQTREAVVESIKCGGCHSYKYCVETYELLPDSSEENCMYANDPTYACRIDSKRLFIQIPLPISFALAGGIALVFLIGVICYKKRVDTMQLWQALCRALCQALGCFSIWLVMALFTGGIAIVRMMTQDLTRDRIMVAGWWILLVIMVLIYICVCLCSVAGLFALFTDCKENSTSQHISSPDSLGTNYVRLDSEPEQVTLSSIAIDSIVPELATNESIN